MPVLELSHPSSKEAGESYANLHTPSVEDASQEVILQCVEAQEVIP